MPKKTLTKKQLANLQPGEHPEGLKQGGAKPRPTLTQKEIDFCSDVARHGVAAWACRDNGIPKNRATQLSRRLQWKIEEMVAQYAAAGLARDLVRREQRRELAHREFTEWMPTIRSHAYKGFEARVKMNELNLKSLGEIQPARITAQASAGASSNAQAQTGLYAKRLYLPEWRRKVIENLEKIEALSPSPAASPAG